MKTKLDTHRRIEPSHQPTPAGATSALTVRHPFDRAGCASLSDLNSADWRELFQKMEAEQTNFLRYESQFRGDDYGWPRDALHCWSRVWEYPYTYHHVQRSVARAGQNTLPRVVDVGSGVTFFPFSVARMGAHVTCIDVDPICGRDLGRAIQAVDASPGRIDFRLCDGKTLPFGDEEADVVYCVSVLEHIPDPTQTVREMARVLKPGGTLLLTIDLDLRGNADIGVEKHHALIKALESRFCLQYPDITVHPADMLFSNRGPYPITVVPAWQLPWYRFKQNIVKPLLRMTPDNYNHLQLAVQGLPLTRR